MRAHPPEVETVLSGSMTPHYEIDVLYDGETVLANVPVVDPQINDDASSAIQTSGSVTVVWQDDFGKSLTPREIGDLLSPFGAELAIYSIVNVGSVSYRVPLGVFPIFDVPSARDETALFEGFRVVTGSVVQLGFKDRFLRVQRDRFDTPGVPESLVSVYDELRRLTGMQVTQSVPDGPITRSVVYEEDRLQAVYDLAAVLDATPGLSPDGTLTLRPRAAGASVATLRPGEDATILTVGQSMTSEGVYNRVAFRGKANDKTAILATAELTQGKLRVRNEDGSPSPFGTATSFLASDYVTSRAQAQAYVERELPRVSQLGAVQVPVETLFNPLYELGDVLTLERYDRTITGRITAISRSSSGRMPMKLEVIGG